MKICVLGAGESGVGAALLAKHLKHEVFVSDGGTILKKFRTEMIENQIDFEAQCHSFDKILFADLIVKSPGIPDDAYVVKSCLDNSIPVISEIEYASRFTKAKLIGITGSNGKTTTTLLTYHILKNAGLSVEMGGNVGKSFARLLTEPHKEFYVLELSSFQLDGCPDLKPFIAILLNITPDHLDRYNYRMEHYIESKFRITANQQKDDYLIFNPLDKNISDFILTDAPSASLLPIPKELVKDGKLVAAEDLNINLELCSLKGMHNHMNIYCALKVAQILGVSKEKMEEGLSSFKNAPHRMELVTTYKGIEFINDSKATNVDATFYALQATESPIIWIAGGVDKGNDYQQIEKLVAQKVKTLICLGSDNSKLEDFFKTTVLDINSCNSMTKAIEIAKQKAEKGDVVLLSPACASFDLFKNYIDRGDQFKKKIEELNK